jgi:hypothetical protein
MQNLVLVETPTLRTVPKGVRGVPTATIVAQCTIHPDEVLIQKDIERGGCPQCVKVAKAERAAIFAQPLAGIPIVVGEPRMEYVVIDKKNLRAKFANDVSCGACNETWVVEWAMRWQP